MNRTYHGGHGEHRGNGIDSLTSAVIGCAIEVHRVLGPGLLESTYQACLSRELQEKQIEHVCEQALLVEYKGMKLDCGYRVDILVQNSLILELKSVSRIDPIHEAQLLTYLKLSGIQYGLLLNFNVPLMKQGIKRYVM
jgi:GxxExxY protein